MLLLAHCDACWRGVHDHALHCIVFQSTSGSSPVSSGSSTLMTAASGSAALAPAAPHAARCAPAVAAASLACTGVGSFAAAFVGGIAWGFDFRETASGRHLAPRRVSGRSIPFTDTKRIGIPITTPTPDTVSHCGASASAPAPSTWRAGGLPCGNGVAARLFRDGCVVCATPSLPINGDWPLFRLGVY